MRRRRRMLSASKVEDLASAMAVAVGAGQAQRAGGDGGIGIGRHDDKSDPFPAGSVDEAYLGGILGAEAAKFQNAIEHRTRAGRSIVPRGEGVADPSHLAV